MVQGRARAGADGVDPLHGNSCGRELPPGGDLTREWRLGAGYKRQGDGVFGQLHALQEQHGRQPADAQKAPRIAGDLFPGHVQQVTVGLVAPTCVGTVFEGPDRRQLHVGWCSGAALSRPARHGHTVGVGMVHLLVQRELALGQAVDHMHLPQRSTTVQHGCVQSGYKIVQRLAVIAGFGQRVKVHVLGHVEFVDRLPMGQRAQRELDHPVERWFDIDRGDIGLVEVLRKSGTRFGWALEDQQTAHVFGAGSGLSNEKAQVE